MLLVATRRLPGFTGEGVHAFGGFVPTSLSLDAAPSPTEHPAATPRITAAPKRSVRIRSSREPARPGQGASVGKRERGETRRRISADPGGSPSSPLMLLPDGAPRAVARVLGSGGRRRMRGDRRARGSRPDPGRRGDRPRIGARYRYRRAARSSGAARRRERGGRAEGRRLHARSERRSVHEGRRLLQRQVRRAARVRRDVQVVGYRLRSDEHERVLRRPLVQREHLQLRALHPVRSAGGVGRDRPARALVLLAHAEDRVERVPVDQANGSTISAANTSTR